MRDLPMAFNGKPKTKPDKKINTNPFIYCG